MKYVCIVEVGFNRKFEGEPPIEYIYYLRIFTLVAYTAKISRDADLAQKLEIVRVFAVKCRPKQK